MITCYPVIKIKTHQARHIVSKTFPNYTGRKFKVAFVDSITFHDTNWGDGTRNYYAAIAPDGKEINLEVPAPWKNFFEGTTHLMPENALIVCHFIFCGHDRGITIFAHPCHQPKWLESPKE
mgnify:CR=1 FL=1